MKKFLEKCYKCNVSVKKSEIVKDGIKLNCMKCPKCHEEYYTSSELMKYDVLKGNKKMIRKFGRLSNSIAIRVPENLVNDLKINEGDFGYFEKRPEGLLIKHIKKEIFLP